MKKITLLSLGISLTVSSSVAATSVDEGKTESAKVRISNSLRHEMMVSPLARFKKHDVHQRREASKNEVRFLTRAENASKVWKAKTQKAFGWNGEEWELDQTYSMEYNDAGLVAVETCEDFDGHVTRETNTYDANGMLIGCLSDEAESPDAEFTPSSRLTRTYDSILTSFITSNDQQLWDGSDWTPGNCYTQTITRNAEGKITLMERAVLFQGKYDPTYRFEVEYGQDGMPISIVESELTYDYDSEKYEWVTSSELTNIEWVACNGQLVSTDEIFSKENRIKSATMLVEDTLADLSVVYDEDGGECYSATVTFTIPYDDDMEINATSVQTFSPLSFSGEDAAHGKNGFTYTTLTTMEMMGIEMSEKITETGIYDENDLIVLEKVEYEEDGDSFIDSMIEGEIVYDDAEGYPLTWTVSEYDYDTEEMNLTFRAEYSDYEEIEISGVNNIASDSTVEASYYNLFGQRVSNPTAGLFIRVKDGKGSKVLVK